MTQKSHATGTGTATQTHDGMAALIFFGSVPCLCSIPSTKRRPSLLIWPSPSEGVPIRGHLCWWIAVVGRSCAKTGAPEAVQGAAPRGAQLGRQLVLSDGLRPWSVQGCGCFPFWASGTCDVGKLLGETPRVGTTLVPDGLARRTDKDDKDGLGWREPQEPPTEVEGPYRLSQFGTPMGS